MCWYSVDTNVCPPPSFVCGVESHWIVTHFTATPAEYPNAVTIRVLNLNSSFTLCLTARFLGLFWCIYNLQQVQGTSDTSASILATKENSNQLNRLRKLSLTNANRAMRSKYATQYNTVREPDTHRQNRQVNISQIDAFSNLKVR